MEERRVEVSSSVQISRSLIAISEVKFELRRRRGLLVEDRDEDVVVVVVKDDGVETIREDEGIGEEVPEPGVPTDLMRLAGGVAASMTE